MNLGVHPGTMKIKQSGSVLWAARTDNLRVSEEILVFVDVPGDFAPHHCGNTRSNISEKCTSHSSLVEGAAQYLGGPGCGHFRIKSEGEKTERSVAGDRSGTRRLQVFQAAGLHEDLPEKLFLPE